MSSAKRFSDSRGSGPDAPGGELLLPGPPTPGRKSSGEFLGLLLAASVAGAAAGAVAAYCVVGRLPTAPQIAVLDTEEILKQLVADDPTNPRNNAKALAGAVKLRTQALANMGFVVIDRNSVIDAPPAAFVDLEQFKYGQPASP